MAGGTVSRARIIEPSEMAPDGGTPEKRPDYSALDTEAAHVLRLWDDWESERSTKQAVWLECEKAYLSIYQPNDQQMKWRSKRFVPVSYNAVESIHAQLMNGLFPHVDSFFEVLPMDEEYELRAAVVRDMLRQQLALSDFRVQFSAFLKQLIIIGSSAAMVDWDATSQTSRFVPLDMRYFHVDPFAGTPSTANKMRRYWLSEAEALDSGLFDEAAVARAALGATKGGWTSGRADSEAAAKARFAGRSQGINPERGEIEITELWGTFEIDGRLYENHVLSVGNGEVLRFHESPFDGRDPFVFARYSVVPGEVYGVGPLEPALPLQDLINTFVNQKVDELSILINGIYKYVDDGVFDPDNFVLQPGAMAEVGDINNLVNLARDASALSLAYTEIADLERKFEETTGAIKMVVGGAGASTGDRTTATEIMALTQAGNSRFNELLSHIEAQALTPALQAYLRNAREFMDAGFAVRTFADDSQEQQAWVEVTRDDIDPSRYMLQMGGSKLVGVREMRLNNMLRYLQTAGQVPALVQRMDWEAVNRRIWAELGFDPDSVPLLAPEVAQPQQQPQQPEPEPGAAPNTALPGAASPVMEQLMNAMGAGGGSGEG